MRRICWTASCAMPRAPPQLLPSKIHWIASMNGGHAPRSLGSTASRQRWTITKMMSNTTAIATHSTLAARISALKSVSKPSLSSCPRPPYDDDCADGGQGDRRDRRDPQSRHDDRQRERELDRERAGDRAVTVPDGGLADLVGHRAQSGEHVADQDRQRVEREADDHGRSASDRCPAGAARTTRATGSCR